MHSISASKQSGSMWASESHVTSNGKIYKINFATKTFLGVTQLLHQPLHIYKIYKIYTLKH